jgi:uncharacterized protein (DUF1499 family)
MLKRLLVWLIALGWWLLPPVAPAFASLLHLEGPVPADLGVRGERLAPCPSPAHCAEAHWPVQNPLDALQRLLPAVLSLEGVEMVETTDRYLHATVTSRFFGFVDDLELLADPDHGQILARSQSRLGDSDLGVNGRRLERLAQALSASSRSAPVSGRLVIPAGG